MAAMAASFSRPPKADILEGLGSAPALPELVVATVIWHMLPSNPKAEARGSRIFLFATHRTFVIDDEVNPYIASIGVAGLCCQQTLLHE
jgi:hypothetical protein